MKQNEIISVTDQLAGVLNEEELERRRSEARILELKVARKMSELKRAREEQALLKELRTINAMAIKRKDLQDNSTDVSLKISLESLTVLNRLDAELKLENKKTRELQDETNIIARNVSNVEESLEVTSTKLATAKRVTGWKAGEKFSKVGVGILNEHKERKNVLTVLQDQQATLKGTSERLTKEIERLEMSSADRTAIEEQITEAENVLRQQTSEYNLLVEKVASYARLRKKKERMLNNSKSTDNYKTVHELDEDKKNYQSYLAKLQEASASNTKSILSLEVRLRQLETRLESANLFLKQKFYDAQAENPIEGISSDVQEIPLIQFEELSREWELSCETVLQRDNQLEVYDAKVEVLENKINVIRSAIASRNVTAQLFDRQKDTHLASLVSNVNHLSRDFEEEFHRLSKENQDLRKKIATQ